LFVCFGSHEQFFSYLATLIVTGNRAVNLELCLEHLHLLAVMVLLRATVTATRNLRFKVISERPLVLTFECRALGEGTITTSFKRLRFDAADLNWTRTHDLPGAK
jgi:hypothetical protein